MSALQNEKWLEAAQENFLGALEDDDIEMCKAIIADVQEAGFTEAGREMNLQLRKATTEKSYE